MNTQICLLVLLCSTGYSLGAKFSSQCHSNTDCPENAECMIRGCDGSICLCNLNYIPTDDYSRCIRVAELGEKCNESSRCRGIRTRCADNGTCQCQSGYTPSGSYKSRTLCKKVLTDGSYALLGEKCDLRGITCEETDTQCVNGTCICKENFRTATQEEKNAYPFNFFQCVKKDFKLNVLVAQSECSLFPAPAHPAVNTQVLSTTTTRPLPTINGLTSGLLLASQTASASILTPSTPAIKQTVSSESFVSLTNMSSSLSAPFNTDATLSSVMPTASSVTSPTTGEFHTVVTTSSTGGIDLFASTQRTTISRTPNISPSSEISLSETTLFTPSLNSKQILPSREVTATPIRITLSTSTVTAKASIAITTNKLQTAPSLTSTYPTDISSRASPNPMYSSALVTSTENITPLKSSESVIPSTGYQYGTPIVTGIHSNIATSMVTIMPTSVIMSQSNHLMTSSVSLRPTSSANHNPSPTGSAPGTTVFTTTPKVEVIGNQCSKGHICPPHSMCEPDLCGVHRCRCSSGYIVNNGGAECIPLSPLGSACVSDVQCIGPNTKCHNGACTCESKYILNNDKKRCKRDTTWFVAFPLLHGKCKNFFADCYNDFEQECSAGRCKCRHGLREATLGDIYTKHKSFAQCRNFTLPTDSTNDMAWKTNIDLDLNDYRSTASCDGDLIQIEPDPTSDEANRKINVMKGAVIGGICGFVVLLASAIATILLVRHKRRTKIRHIRTDTTSLNSFDRRSSGKYSFRLPRPFAFDLGKDKEWEAEHLSVHNSEFEPTTDSDTILTLKDSDCPHMNGTFSNPVDVSDIPSAHGSR